MLNQDMTRPIVGIENRSAQEVFDIMSDRILSALSAQVQDESEIIECLLSGKPFVFDPATNFCHADDGGAPEHGIKYVPAAQVQDVAGWHRLDDAFSNFINGYGDPYEPKEAHEAETAKNLKELYEAFTAYRAAAPAKQEGCHD